MNVHIYLQTHQHMINMSSVSSMRSKKKNYNKAMKHTGRAKFGRMKLFYNCTMYKAALHKDDQTYQDPPFHIALTQMFRML